jgi:hypothetical protein
MEIHDAESFAKLVGLAGYGWSQEQAAAVLFYWLRAIDAYTDSGCDAAILEQHCCHLGAAESAGDWLCDWIDRQGKGRDPQPLWDACLALSNQLDGDEIGGKAISHAFDRATPLFRWLLNPEKLPPVMSDMEGYLPGQAALKLGVSVKTVNRYAKLADILRPSRGQRDFRYSPKDFLAICRHCANSPTDSRVAAKAKAILETETKRTNGH